MRRPTIDHAANIIAIVTFVLVVVRALGTVDTNWDTLQYHWAYAARAAGLCDASCFTMDFGTEQRYLAFPMLFHTVYGALWRIFGTPAAGHAATIAIVVAFIVYLWRRFAVPPAWTWLAMLAVPLVQIHLSTSYVDLAANAALALGIFALLRICVAREGSTTLDIAAGWAALTLAAGSKLLLIAPAALVWMAIVIVVAQRRWHRERRVPWGMASGLAALGVVSILPQFALNTWHFHNPFYPVAMRIAGIHLPGTESLKVIQHTMSVSTQWIDFPGWMRWVASVFEFDAFRGRDMLWTADQGDVLQSNPSFRMGGYFCVYVAGLIAILLSRARDRASRPMLVTLAVATVVCALLPNSHELRYYLFWMLLLAGIVLLLAFSPLLASGSHPETARMTRALVLLSLTGVILMTGARYLMTKGTTLKDLVTPTNAVVDALPPGATLCVAHADRNAILYAQIFHPGHSIHVRSIDGERAAGCDEVITAQ